MKAWLMLAGIGWMAALLHADAQLRPAEPAGVEPHASVAFASSAECAACHNGLKTAEGEDVSIESMWRATMMANSARDPYFHAAVRREVTDFPEASAEIQDECAACHAPMLQRTSRAEGRHTDLLEVMSGRGVTDGRHALAADGVSCTVCHQVSASGLGTRDSFNGRFQMAAPAPDGSRPIFGPYTIDRGRTTVMRSVTGFSQTEAPHVRDSALCATCHTLYTHARGPNGTVLGELPEQTNFQEWQHSAFNAEQRSCQTCHMPDVPGATKIASVLGDSRDGFSRHVFVGGNAFMLRLLNANRAELGVTASPAQFEATIAATERQLAGETATVSISALRQSVDTVVVDVTVRSLAGHKFPTGYPSRRAWLHLAIRDASGRLVYQSGALQPDGSISGNDNDEDARAFEPHYDEIDDPGEVQIYESIMAGADGQVTTGLLTALRYVKDNRLLPRGFEKATAGPDIAVVGNALADANFQGESDRVRYRVRVPASAGPLTAGAELRYQPIAFRWMANLQQYDAPETRRFVGYYRALANQSSSLVASATARVD